ncbi:MAG: Glycosyl transferase family 2 [Parcubacteria group bacterium GW2011_GWA1_48_11b]|uniref:GtrA/DPMS transmembrane domain-containing protein n=2 Tax=Parcubacteria group TaxID=1794811 RepID=A0A1F8EYG8_9BACT|nr:MAG: Glycosyl transferase family 2 [Candidatus Giovannonibacteria bacterium GW2011_GWB1_47_6b]KKU95117.1 MAG: Glycosyl transferase family 2 [Parcubacteria group bacterium GW2011_GWA1_48_11b]OGN05079.1 MAG: hypothetical protein A2746_02275 [Candidatus Yanofskybacteria bacterium RIFCSPHIGHO2_01_FULL_44_22]
MKFTKKDLFFSLATGFITGFSAWRIFSFLKVPELYGWSFAWLIILVPVLWILGVNLGYFLGKWLPFFNQFGRFAAVGFTNAAVDFDVLNILIFLTGISAGIFYPVFKSVSFVAAVSLSYLWNKYWVFGAGQKQASGMEVVKFFTVSMFSLAINAGTASLIVNFMPPIYNLEPEAWANAGAVAGAAVALLFNFSGLKLIVFKK